MDLTINIKESFSEYPGLRHCLISENSGEEFYHKILNSEFKKAYENQSVLTIVLDGTQGYAPSFLDEAFGNLVYDFSLPIVESHVKIVSEEEPYWKKMIKTDTFQKWEDRRKQKDAPKTTTEHSPWYRLIDNSLELNQWKK